MASSNNKQLISIAKPHTIKKFELIESYIETWVQKLLNNPKCKRIVFIDCMCNSGLYYDENGEIVKGTPIRVANVLRSVAGQYPHKQVFIYFND
jgi:three-Cys-motif partner protein